MNNKLSLFGEIESLIKKKAEGIVPFYFGVFATDIDKIKEFGLVSNKPSLFDFYKLKDTVQLRTDYTLAFKDVTVNAGNQDYSKPIIILEIRLPINEFQISDNQGKYGNHIDKNLPENTVSIKDNIQIKFIKGAYTLEGKFEELTKLKNDTTYVSPQKLNPIEGMLFQDKYVVVGKKVASKTTIEIFAKLVKDCSNPASSLTASFTPTVNNNPSIEETEKESKDFPYTYDKQGNTVRQCKFKVVKQNKSQQVLLIGSKWDLSLSQVIFELYTWVRISMAFTLDKSTFQKHEDYISFKARDENIQIIVSKGASKNTWLIKIVTSGVN